MNVVVFPWMSTQKSDFHHFDTSVTELWLIFGLLLIRHLLNYWSYNYALLQLVRKLKTPVFQRCNVNICATSRIWLHFKNQAHFTCIYLPRYLKSSVFLGLSDSFNFFDKLKTVLKPFVSLELHVNSRRVCLRNVLHDVKY